MIADEVIGMYGRAPAPSRFKYIVEYTDPSGETRRAEVEQVGRFIRWMIAPPIGATVPLLVHRRSGAVRFDHKDPQINTFADQKRQRSARRQSWDEELRGG